MPLSEELRQTEKVRAGLTKLQNELEYLDGSASVASVYLPNAEAFDGLAGGDPQVLPLVLEDAIGRVREFYCAQDSLETAERVLTHALERVLGRKVVLGESIND